MKGQSLIVQFLLFFLIGLALFTSIAGIFRLQSDIVRGDIAESNRKLVNSYLSSAAISMANSCKECDFMNYSLKLKNLTANYFVTFGLSKSGILISSEPGGGNFSSSMHNLNRSLVIGGGGTSAYPIILRLNKTINQLDMSIGQ